MASGENWTVILPRPLRTLPADLAAALLANLLTLLAVFLPVVKETPLRIVIGLPFVLFIPGYVLIAALFPERPTAVPESAPTDDTAETVPTEGIDGIERVALSFGTSIAVVPLIGLLLNFTPWGIRLGPIVASLTAFVVALTAIAADRRWELPEDERFRVPYKRWLASAKTEFLSPDTRTDGALNVILVVSLLLAFGAVGYAVAVPSPGEQFSEFYLLTEDDSGELTADNFPTEFTAGEPQPVVVGIGNHEQRPVTYTVVSSIQRVEQANNTTRVLEEERLQTYSTTLEHNKTRHRQHEVAPTLTGEELRLVYLLYRGEPPANPTTSNAYRELHLWVNVSR